VTICVRREMTLCLADQVAWRGGGGGKVATRIRLTARMWGGGAKPWVQAKRQRPRSEGQHALWDPDEWAPPGLGFIQNSKNWPKHTNSK
jgi:hypothetical protein